MRVRLLQGRLPALYKVNKIATALRGTRRSQRSLQQVGKTTLSTVQDAGLARGRGQRPASPPWVATPWSEAEAPPGSTSVVAARARRRGRRGREPQASWAFFDAVVRRPFRLQRPALNQFRAVVVVEERADSIEKEGALVLARRRFGDGRGGGSGRIVSDRGGT